MKLNIDFDSDRFWLIISDNLKQIDNLSMTNWKLENFDRMWEKKLNLHDDAKFHEKIVQKHPFNTTNKWKWTENEMKWKWKGNESKGKEMEIEQLFVICHSIVGNSFQIVNDNPLFQKLNSEGI
jgi:hypothetical protein